MTLPYNEYRAVFFKEIAYYIEGRYEEYVQLPDVIHTFIIRNPLKIVHSLHKGNTRLNFEFHADEVGFHPLYKMYCTVQQHLDPSPIVIDADDLLENPRGIMEEYCNRTGLPFQESMLTWSPGVVPDWEHCLGYRTQVA